MREILLVRHGRVSCDRRTRIRGREFGGWVMAYDAASLDLSLAPPRGLVDQIAATEYIATSTLRRAIESAALLAGGRPVISDSLFDEAGVPVRFPFGLALRPEQWDVVARTAWFAGWSGAGESFRQATRRADRAGEHLSALARAHGSVTLVGHGMLNTLIGRALRRRGWTGAGSPRAYWGVLRMSLGTT